MKLMIIDDEKNIREGLHYSIEWKNIGIEEVRDYACAEEALAQFSTFSPDIVISDIRMDGMSGLEFFESAKKISSDFQIIFISGYADFEYAVQAVRLGAADYELKPINNEKLIKLVEKIKEQIIDNTKQKEIIKEIEKNNRAKKTFELLNSDSSIEDIKIYFESVFNLDFKQRVIITVLEADKNSKLNLEDINRCLHYYCTNLEKRVNILFREVSDGVCICATEANPSYIYSFNVQHLIKRSIEYVNGSEQNTMVVSAAISGITRVGEIIHTYRQLKEKIRDKFYDGPGSIYVIDLSGNKLHVEENVVINELTRKFVQLFNEKNMSELKNLIECIKTKWKQSRESSEQEIKKQISGIMKEIMYKQVSTNEAVIIDIIQFNEQINQFEYLDDVTDFWIKSIESYFAECSERRDKTYSKNIRKALEYITDNYRKQISVENVSEYISKTPNYFSMLFKKETGMSFSEYINILRIKKAKELMDTSDMLLNEIAEYVGYSNYIYFTQIFKKIEGVSPSKNRKMSRTE